MFQFLPTFRCSFSLDFTAHTLFKNAEHSEAKQSWQSPGEEKVHFNLSWNLVHLSPSVIPGLSLALDKKKKKKKLIPWLSWKKNVPWLSLVFPVTSNMWIMLSLISDKNPHQQNPCKWRVFIGENRDQHYDESTQDIQVEKIIAHKGYSKCNNPRLAQFLHQRDHRKFYRTNTNLG